MAPPLVYIFLSLWKSMCSVVLLRGCGSGVDIDLGAYLQSGSTRNGELTDSDDWSSDDGDWDE
jgi:hypothetical protein